MPQCKSYFYQSNDAECTVSSFLSPYPQTHILGCHCEQPPFSEFCYLTELGCMRSMNFSSITWIVVILKRLPPEQVLCDWNMILWSNLESFTRCDFWINRSKYGYYSSDLFGTAVTLSERVANGGDRSKKWRFWCLHAMLFSWSIDKKTANADSTYIELVTISDYIQGLHDYVIALLRVPTI